MSPIAAMVTIALSTTMLATAAPPATASPEDSSLEQTLIALERQSWTAWKAQDASFFDGFLSDDHVELWPVGPAGKEAVVSGVRSGGCRVESYAVSAFRFTRLSSDSAVLVYRAEQKTTCGGHPVPSPVWATSIYARRDGQWMNILYEQLPAAPAQKPAPS